MTKVKEIILTGIFTLVVANFFSVDALGQRWNKFENVVMLDSFVDKSLFLMEVFKRKSMFFVTAPPGFGKSTNLHMLKEFFKISVNSTGHVIERTETDPYKVFKRMKIAEKTKAFGRNFQKYPVVHFNFSPLVSVTNFADFETAWTKIILTAFSEHNYLQHSAKVDGAEKDIFSINLLTPPSGFKLSFTHAVTLTKFLKLHFDSPCIILIENYDALLHGILTRDTLEKKYINNILMELAIFVRYVIKNNENIRHSFVTGVLHFQDDLALVNDIEHTYFSDRMQNARFFGLTRTEVYNLATKMGKRGEMKNIEKWYEGYHVLDADTRIYSTHSILQYFKTGKFESYWINSQEKTLLDPLFGDLKVGNKIQELLSGGKMKIKLRSRVAPTDLIELKNKIKADDIITPLTDDEADFFLQILLERGFLTASKKIGNVAEILPPNLEIRKALGQMLYKSSYLENSLYIKVDKEKVFVNSLRSLANNSQSFDDFADALSGLFTDAKTMPLYGSDIGAILYHVATRNSFEGREPDFEIVQREVRTEKGSRSDLIILRKDMVAIVLELAYPAGAADTALRQIVQKDYTSIFDFDKNDFVKYKVKHKIYIGARLDSKDRLCKLAYLFDSLDLGKMRTSGYNATKARAGVKPKARQKPKVTSSSARPTPSVSSSSVQPTTPEVTSKVPIE